MNYSIPTSPQEIFAMQQQPVDEELVAVVIAGVVRIGRSQGQSLDELRAQVLADDQLLDRQQRNWLSQLVSHAWDNFP